jgi:hypothetical protein
MADNANRLSYSPQIPRLTPAAMKDQAVLDRITDHLRSLTLIAGNGIELSRQATSGTRIDASAAAGQYLTGRSVSCYMDGDVFCVYCPSIKYFLSQTPLYSISNTSSGFMGGHTTIAEKHFRFTGGFPTYVGIRPKEYSGTVDEWIHSGSDGEDSETQTQYVASSGFASVCRIRAKSGSSIFDIPYTLPDMACYCHWNHISSINELNVRDPFLYYSSEVIGSNNGGKWVNSSLAAVTGRLYITPRTINASTASTNIYYELDEEWYTAHQTGNIVVQLKIQSEMTSGHIYYLAGQIETDSANRLIKAIGPNPFPPVIPMSQLSPSATYLKTIGGTTGVVTGNHGLITGAT